MTVDFAALARSMVAVPGVRACLVVSREGLPLAAEPEALEDEATAALNRLSALGDVEKGFVAMGGEMWVFAHRGPFSAFVIAEPSARAGVVLTQLEQALLAADESRVRDREEMRAGPGPAPVPEPVAAPRFRAPLHRPQVAPAPAPVEAAPVAAAIPPTIAQAIPAEGPARAPARTRDREEEWVVDAVEIAREFGGLYGESGSEGSD